MTLGVAGITDNPFDLNNETAYRQWRRAKLTDYPRQVDALLVPVQNPAKLTEAEHAAILARCRKTNMAVYRAGDDFKADKSAIHALGMQFGLQRLDHNLCADEDGIAALQVSEGGRSQEYIPYSDKPINWHTDGYYNAPQQQVQAMVLHCARPADGGGENACLDHEMAYLLLRDENPDYIAALMRPDTMNVPANTENGAEIRPAQNGPVFSITPEGKLHMRYTLRKRHIQWRQDPVLQQALDFLQILFQSGADCIFRYRMNTNEGLICNNVLHNRGGFHDSPQQQRLMYRARYYDRIAGT